jgi:hypothetical protein
MCDGGQARHAIAARFGQACIANTVGTRFTL